MKSFKKIVSMLVVFVVLWLCMLFFSSVFMSNGHISDMAARISAIISLVIVLIGEFIIEYNKVQRIKATIPGLKKDVEALEERREHQLEQANKVLDKFMTHEKGVQEAVAKSHVRSGAKFQILVEERYPELLANEAVANLMAQINKVEDELVSKKEKLNACVSDYNSSIHSFPVVMVKGIAKLEDVVLETSSVLNEEEISDEDLGI